MKNMIFRFRNSEYGAVTVDWVVLTAVILAAVILLTVPLQNAATGVLTAVSEYMNSTGTNLGARNSAIE